MYEGCITIKIFYAGKGRNCVIKKLLRHMEFVCRKYKSMRYRHRCISIKGNNSILIFLLEDNF